jgi:hypothetical protein
MTTTQKTSPKPPVGAYPRSRLCDQRGSAPISARTRITINMVPSIFDSFLLASPLSAFVINVRPASSWSKQLNEDLKKKKEMGEMADQFSREKCRQSCKSLRPSQKGNGANPNEWIRTEEFN